MAWKSVDLPTLARPTWDPNEHLILRGEELCPYNATLQVVPRASQRDLLLLDLLLGRHLTRLCVAAEGCEREGGGWSGGKGEACKGCRTCCAEGRSEERENGGRRQGEGDGLSPALQAF